MPGDLLAWPRNLIALGALMALSLLARPLRASKFFRFLTSVPFSVILICAMALFALVMGLVPQLAPKANLGSVLGPGQDSPVARLGFLQVTSSWPFAVLYLMTLVGLGATVAIGFGFRRRVFLLNHLGLWLILLAAGLGASDRQRELMRVPEGGVEWRASREGEFAELDLAIRLDDFVMEEYPARLALVNPATGKPWPSESAPALFQIEPKSPRGRLGGFDIEVLQFLARAVPVGEEGFAGAVVNGAVQAALVKATDRETGQSFEGWLTAGNGFVGPSSLRLGEGGADRPHGLVLAMTQPEPKLFLSKVKVFTKDGHEAQANVSVNHPLRAGDWLIYQRDYDTSAGPLSRWSGFELIKDRWLWLAYAGFALWSMGCLGLTMGGRK
ncbi:MAG: cytochrome c biogenesis protein ResB [Deltaproteobacteria bacterium]|jgi:hypothetical protein|nr:cytochrome c biogenesis protein ResB [Deltaproteobacteria bacterium]